MAPAVKIVTSDFNISFLCTVPEKFAFTVQGAPWQAFPTEVNYRLLCLSLCCLKPLLNTGAIINSSEAICGGCKQFTHWPAEEIHKLRMKEQNTEAVVKFLTATALEPLQAIMAQAQLSDFIKFHHCKLAAKIIRTEDKVFIGRKAIVLFEQRASADLRKMVDSWL